jgi:hypothetical protein
MTHEMVFMLDLDKCSLYGNDGNDLGIALQWMDRSYEDVLALYRCARRAQASAMLARSRFEHELAAAVVSRLPGKRSAVGA